MATGTEAQETDPRADSSQDAASSIADPGPLGLAAFALTTFVLSVFNAGLLSEDLEPVVLPLALFYGGLAQLLAGMWEFRKANTFGAVAFTSYGAFWLSFAAYVKFVSEGLGPDGDKATALFLLAWGIFTAYMTVAALRVNVSVLAVFVALTLTFLVLAYGDFTGAKTVVHAGGYLGLITAVLAWYGSFAAVANATWKRTLLPVGPLAPQ
ncbi:acetate uptake transporter [Saccharopolyspora sp. SCSIO 74807]|uniref:acetate uptake transporter n=1 Tax=Saccharopolyspora sp. SCSIO 74807 TaxID=3118084 RepID=UPI0030D582DC